jgi:hypothetical protein
MIIKILEGTMKKKLMTMLILGGCLAAGTITSLAQERKPMPSEMKVQTEEDTFKILAEKIALGNTYKTNVKGAPYAATATTETVQTLSDGNQIIRRNQTTFYRDSEGRSRVEQTLGTIGKWTAGSEAQQIIFINDPVANINYSIDPRGRTAMMMRMQPVDEERVVDEKAKVEAKLRTKMEILKVQADEAKPRPEPWQLEAGRSDDARKKIEMLGKQMMEGVEVVGTRATVTIPAGEIGNVLPIEVVDETWYSPELQMMVMTKRSDPRSGVTTYRLTIHSRGEPDRTLFEVPPGYTVNDTSTLLRKKRSPNEEE